MKLSLSPRLRGKRVGVRRSRRINDREHHSYVANTPHPALSPRRRGERGGNKLKSATPKSVSYALSKPPRDVIFRLLFLGTSEQIVGWPNLNQTALVEKRRLI